MGSDLAYESEYDRRHRLWIKESKEAEAARLIREAKWLLELQAQDESAAYIPQSLTKTADIKCPGCPVMFSSTATQENLDNHILYCKAKPKVVKPKKA